MSRRRIVQVNAAWQIEKDAALFGYVLRLLADVITAVELRHRDGSKMPLRPWLKARYHVVQSMRSLGASMAAIAVRRGGVRLRRRLPVRLASRAARGVGPRVWREAVLEGDKGLTHVLVSHSPLSRTGVRRMWVRALRARCRWLTARGRRWILATDANGRLDVLAWELGGTAYGFGIDGFVVGPGVRVHSCRPDHRPKRDGLTDHPLVILDVEL